MDVGKKIDELLSGRILEKWSDRSQYWIRLKPEDIVESMRILRYDGDLKFDYLTDICGVDNLPKKPRFQVVYRLFSKESGFSLGIKVDVPEDTLNVPTVTPVWKAADWLEREAYDMYGIRFHGHPDLRRILMHEDFKRYPQRKDFPLKGWREKD